MVKWDIHDTKLFIILNYNNKVYKSLKKIIRDNL